MLTTLPAFAAETSPWLAVFGRCHPLLLHAPLGILPAILLLEFGSAALRRPTPRGAVLALCWLLVATAASATASGLLLAGEGGSEGPTVGQHKIAAFVFTGVCTAAAVAAFAARRLWPRLLLLAAGAAMVPVGHLGGSLTHGADFLFAPLREGKAAAHPVVGGTAEGEFRRMVVPVLERTCTQCHNADKQKGELLLTTVDGIRKGGENGVVVEAGQPDASPLLERCELPLADDDHMPPEGKPQPTAVELAALRMWILGGAKFD
jgi:hypothetical protein